EHGPDRAGRLAHRPGAAGPVAGPARRPLAALGVRRQLGLPGPAPAGLGHPGAHRGVGRRRRGSAGALDAARRGRGAAGHPAGGDGRAGTGLPAGARVDRGARRPALAPGPAALRRRPRPGRAPAAAARAGDAGGGGPAGGGRAAVHDDHDASRLRRARPRLRGRGPGARRHPVADRALGAAAAAGPGPGRGRVPGLPRRLERLHRHRPRRRWPADDPSAAAGIRGLGHRQRRPGGRPVAHLDPAAGGPARRGRVAGTEGETV
ncbi:MAG: ABC transporter, permease protein, partial [uncultured Blastococcus sp.]